MLASERRGAVFARWTLVASWANWAADNDAQVGKGGVERSIRPCFSGEAANVDAGLPMRLSLAAQPLCHAVAASIKHQRGATPAVGDHG
jgi:hypothetical protein